MISKSEFLELAKSYQVIPIVDSVFSGTETPLTIFEKLASTNPGSFGRSGGLVKVQLHWCHELWFSGFFKWCCDLEEFGRKLTPSVR